MDSRPRIRPPAQSAAALTSRPVVSRSTKPTIAVQARVEAATSSSADQVVGDERGTPEQVLGRVAGHRELGEDREVHAATLGFVESGEDARPTLPERSPTTVFTWHAATRIRSIGRQPTGAVIRAFLGEPPKTAVRTVEFIGRSQR